MRLWLDDVRVAPPDWVWCVTAERAIMEIGVNVAMGIEWTEASLDHDLGLGKMQGVHLVDWMANLGIWPTERITVHSMNPVGRETMLRVIDRYGPYTRKPDLFTRSNT